MNVCMYVCNVYTVSGGCSGAAHEAPVQTGLFIGE